MEKNNVSYLMHESEVARLERIIKRLWILCIIIFSAFVISNGLWIYYESQWMVVEETKIEQEAQSEGGNAIVNNNGDLNYGYSEAENNQN